MTGRRKTRTLPVDTVRDDIRARIDDGRYRPGERLPAEAELAAEHGVSRLTLREAVRGLVEEGYLARRHGTGTFVIGRAKLRNNLGVNMGVTQLIDRMGMASGVSNLQVRSERADEQISSSLSIRPGSVVRRVERVRTADDRPVVYSVEWIPEWVIPEPATLEAISGSLYALLERTAGIRIHHGIATISAVSATALTARILGVRAGSPLLYSSQIDYDEDEQPCIYSSEWYRPDQIELQIYRKGSRV
jgi:GntR family transcriptional regulator